MKYKLIGFIKGFLLFSRIPLLLSFLRHPFQFSANTMGLSKWIKKHGSAAKFNDFYVAKRNYDNRLKLFDFVAEQESLVTSEITYLEFGVYSGRSFQWWLSKNANPQSRFFGFDTFEGLPEGWLFFKKGDMKSETPTIEDGRGAFVKGLFQHTLFPFLKENGELLRRSKKVIHLDADLFSSTLFTLTTLAPFLNAGDIILFDEFNVPNHEFLAWELFCNSYYVNFEA